MTAYKYSRTQRDQMRLVIRALEGCKPYLAERKYICFAIDMWSYRNPTIFHEGKYCATEYIAYLAQDFISRALGSCNLTLEDWLLGNSLPLGSRRHRHKLRLRMIDTYVEALHKELKGG